MRKDWLLVCTTAVLMVPTSVFAEVIVEIRAVAVNDIPITPMTTVSVSPEDKVEAELILLPGFGTEFPDGVRSAQIVVAGRVGATSGGNDVVIPLGWDSPLDLIQCEVQQDCPFGFACSGDGRCLGNNHFPSIGAFITTDREDYLHFEALDPLNFVATTTLDYVWGTLDQERVGQLDDGGEFYLGTYIVVVGDFACGTFTFDGITSGTGSISTLGSPDGLEERIPTFVPLEINTGACGPLPTDPLNCTLDARYPHPPGGGSSFLGNSFTLEFDVVPTGLSASDFVVAMLPPVFPLPTITDVSVNRREATITMSREFDLADGPAWTCIRHNDTNRTFCRSVLPADSDQSQFSEAADVEALVIDLNPPATGPDGEPYVPLPLEACDIDRSGKCSPADLLGSINLLIGSASFSPGYEGEGFADLCPGRPRL